MLHEHAAEVLERRYEVGAAGRVTGREILEVLTEAARGLREGTERDWVRRIGEDARLVWDLAQEARVATGLRNPAGWLNRAYMRERKVGRWAR